MEHKNTVTDTELTQFKQIYKDMYGVDITTGEAIKLATALILLFESISITLSMPKVRKEAVYV